MDPPMEDIELSPEKLEEEKERGPLIHCDLCDTDLVHKIAQSFLPGLASACIDNTTGGLLKSPASVAVDIRREMVDYLIQRSELFVAEAVVLEGDPGAEVSENPFDIISDFVDDFVSSKRNFFSRVSGWLLSERREDRIDDLVQEMEINGFWLLNRRASVAQTLLKNIDFKNMYHCSSKFKSREDLEEHKLSCGFRTMTCVNEGCNSAFSAGQMDYHDAVCPFKILPCEQKCSHNIMRRDMDRHCITICPMKLLKCPFYSVGCLSLVPQCKIGEHRSENLHSHLVYVLQGFHRKASAEDLKERIEELKKLSSPGQLESARDARTLTIFVKDLDVKLGPIIPKKLIVKALEVATDLIDEKESTALEVKLVVPEDSPRKNEECVINSPSNGNDHNDSNPTKEELVESPRELVAQSQPDKEPPIQREESPRSPVRLEMKVEKSSKEEVIDHADEHSSSPIKQKEQTELIGERETLAESSLIKLEHAEPAGEKVHAELTVKTEVSPESPSRKEHLHLER